MRPADFDQHDAAAAHPGSTNEVRYPATTMTWDTGVVCTAFSERATATSLTGQSHIGIASDRLRCVASKYAVVRRRNLGSARSPQLWPIFGNAPTMCHNLGRVGMAPERFLYGVTTEGGPFAVRELQAASRRVGRALDRVMWFEQFGAAPPVDAIRSVTAMAAVPVVTWEPWRWDRRPTPTMSMLRAGLFDDHVRRWARELAVTGVTVYLRFGHEFNGHWYPWSVPGGTPAAEYVDVWRRIRAIFDAEGAHNVVWVWCANAGLPEGSPLEQWFPGPDYVDVVGIDGYNWGTSQPWSSWIEPAELFGDTIAEVRTLAGATPVTISEVGCAEAGGSKADWITALLSFLCAETTVDGLVWFDHDKETDWRTGSSGTSAAAMRVALQNAQRTSAEPRT
ncbi:hypothetical protein MDUV_14860 [Mycolicibacterium duvalii]|uniref:GH26 domain-containing protein n=2 Tax=Mycolicibacterium duvalii TaxID=39688 RepID=A0A7I7JXK9_9MYCO|nr:hypothetical protein MDUV_14860 [Mycolicibacterium duvalii]